MLAHMCMCTNAAGYIDDAIYFVRKMKLVDYSHPCLLCSDHMTLQTTSELSVELVFVLCVCVFVCVLS